MTDYESWRPALEAFYRAEAMFQSADNVRHGFPLTISDKRMIDSLVAALDHAPEALRRAA